jgi:uracil-DNA glycosylase family 4
MPRPINGEGSATAKLLILGEAPSKTDELTGRVFSGPSGTLLNGWLYANDMAREEVYLTNVLKERPPDGQFKNLPEGYLEKATRELWQEIRAINPNAILALGENALRAVTTFSGISKWRGSILPSVNVFPKIIPTFHPAAFLYYDTDEETGGAKYAFNHIVRSVDVPRAIEESRSRDFSLPKRNLWIAKSVSDVIDFFQRQHGKRIAAVDIETYNQFPTCIGIAFDKYEAISIPLIKSISGITISSFDTTELARIWRRVGGFLSDESVAKVGQNFKFDHEKLEDLGFRVRGPIHDLMLLGHTICPEYPSKKLQFWQSVYTREPYHKDEGKLFDPKKDKIDTYLLYNAKDAVVTRECFGEMYEELSESPSLLNFYTSFVMRLHDFYRDIEAVGFDLDLVIQEELADAYSKIIKDKQEKLDELAGGSFNPNSPKQVGEILYGVLKVPKRRDTKEDTLIALIANTIKDNNHKLFIELLLEQRRLQKALNTYIIIEPDYDGKIRTSYNIVGTETGRSSTSKPDKPVRPYGMGLSFQTVTKRGIDKSAAYKGQNLNVRRMIKPEKGHVIVELDYKNAEGFIVALLSNDLALLELMQQGFDAHRLTASWFFDKTLGAFTVEEVLALFRKGDSRCQMSDVSKEERFIGKAGRHGGNYGEGKRTLMQSIMTGARNAEIDIHLSEWKCGKILDKFHKFSPNVRKVFQSEIIEIVSGTKTLVNPFGRRRTFLGKQDDSMYREAFATIPQGTVPDILRHACLRAKETLGNSFRCVVEWHDAVHLMCPVNEWESIAKIVKDEMEKPTSFEQCSLPRGELSIPVEVQIYEESWAVAKEVKL